LYTASKLGYKDMVKYLVEKGADVNEGNKYGETPLSIACFKNKESIAYYLIEKEPI